MSTGKHKGNADPLTYVSYALRRYPVQTVQGQHTGNHSPDGEEENQGLSSKLQVISQSQTLEIEDKNGNDWVS
jgi:hypothetical protein